ncbi:MAG: molybdopterin-dependent oxidoreductase [Gammaproteobacteria bacterium]|nr:molybdopterin-dependent oxidoreductase [Gammaproteobacteria bacterium]
MKLSIILWGIPWAMRVAALVFPKFAERLKEKDVIAQFALKEDPTRGRWIRLQNGRIASGAGVHPEPTFTIFFKNAQIAADFLTPPFNQLERIHAAKNFQITMAGPDKDIVWFMHMVASMESYTWKRGTDMGDGVTRYTNGTNGGPIFVYVKDGKIIRTTPMDLDDSDPGSYTIEARGKTFTPPRKTTLAAHGACQKSMVYSKNRILKPMKRVDFDPNGERNIQNRGKSEFVEIEWDEAIEIVSGEIKRCKKVGPGAIAVANGSHHQWGNLGHYLSAFNRFWNLIGVTKLMHTPDSWEGWFWGAQHHWGNSMRLGAAEPYGTVEDCLKNADMMVFWSSDPDASYGFEGTQRRRWAKELGIKMVHIDPYLNHTAAHLGGKWISPKVGTDTAFAQALTYVWITEDTYDKEFVEKRTTGFDEWKAHVLGEDDGIPKTPEWQEGETGIPARDCRALAREWAKKNTYLGVGGWGNGLGGACRGPTGAQWARQMTILGAMQGMGKPGSNLGNLQFGAPVDMNFYFPGYAEGSMSGDLAYSAQSTNNYQRMPHIVTMNSVKQVIPRMWLPEAIMGKPKLGYVTAVDSVVGQFFPIGYPSPGHVPVEMIYKYGSSSLGTQVDSNRWINMYQHENLKFVVNQSVWMEGETKFADVILPACTVFERWDIGEWYNVGPGYVHHMYSMNNHRVISLQHKCIEPLGESKSDYDIFLAIAETMDLGAVYSEGGNSELEWCKRAYESSDCAKDMSWREFLKKGYYVVDPEPEGSRAPLGLNWFYEGRKKDVPEPYPLPSDYVEKYAEGLQTVSGKYEFVPTTLKRFDDPERPPVNKYMKTFENAENEPEIAAKYSLRLLTPHTRYAFHLMGDDEGCFIRDIREHRVKVGEHYYLTCRLSREDAQARDIKDDDLIRLWNDRGSVVCAAQVTDRLRPGVISVPTASAEYRPAGEPGKSTDLGGCVNVLNSSKPITTKSHGIRPNGTLIEVEKWTGIDTWKPLEPKPEEAA